MYVACFRAQWVQRSKLTQHKMSVNGDWLVPLWRIWRDGDILNDAHVCGFAWLDNSINT